MRVMQRTTAKANAARQTLIGMIVSPQVLARVSQIWDKEGPFDTPWANVIGGWCVEYHKNYAGKAPGKNVASLFESWAEEGADKDTVALVEKFLSSISGEYASLKKELNPDLVIDRAGDYFNRVRVTRFKDAIEGDLETGKVAKSLERFDKFKKVELGGGNVIDVLRDRAVFDKVFEDKKEPLIVYPHGLGEFFAGELERDAFIGFMGPAKRGKSWWLLDVAWRAMEQGRKVLILQTGDLSQSQIMRRFMARASKRPFLATRKGRDDAKIPVGVTADEDGKITFEYKEKRWDANLSPTLGWKNFEKVAKATRTNGTLLNLSVHSNTSISVNGIRAMIDSLDSRDWLPDVVVIDYADILAPVNGTADTRDQINMTWKLLRKLSQDIHGLVVTATQTNKASYTAKVIKRSDFADDRRKLDHVTGMVGINQDADEKRNGVQRLNWVALREDEYGEDRCCTVGGCFAIANPAVRSHW